MSNIGEQVMISGQSLKRSKQNMSGHEKKTHTRNTYRERLAEINPDVILVAKGYAKGAENTNLEIRLCVFDNEGMEDDLSDGAYPGSIETFSKGKKIVEETGEIKGLFNAKMPIFLAIYPKNVDKGPYDVVKMYKEGDRFECNFFTEGLSVIWKRANQSSEYTKEDIKKINHYRKESAWRAKLDIDLELTQISVPDNVSDRINKPKVKSRKDGGSPAPGMG